MDNDRRKMFTKMGGFAVFFVCLARSGAAYLNTYDEDLHFSCPHEYQAISLVKSVHNNKREDRVFDMACSDVIDGVTAPKTSCYDTGRTNDFDELLAFQCAGNHYISGMNSYHDNKREDRQWSFKCCQIKDVHLADCDFTDWTNAYDGPQNYNVPSGKVMKGVTSLHDNKREDRIYKYEICSVLKDVCVKVLET